MNVAHLSEKLHDPSTLCLLVLAASVVFLLIRTQQNLKRQRTTNIPLPPAGQYAARVKASEVGESSTEREQWEIELHDQARAFSGQIDTKLALMQTLIAEAHEAALRLEAALDREERLHAPQSGIPEAFEHQESGLDITKLDRNEFHLESTPTEMAGKTVGLRDEICTLADYGFDVSEIARRTGRPRGEVELVLSLRSA